MSTETIQFKHKPQGSREKSDYVLLMAWKTVGAWHLICLSGKHLYFIRLFEVADRWELSQDGMVDLRDHYPELD